MSDFFSIDFFQKTVRCSTSVNDIYKLASAFSSAAYAQTAQITALMAAMMDQQLPETNSNARGNNPRKESNKRGKRTKKPKSYCWFHGITRNMDHNSGTCDNQNKVHHSDATLYNRMGGSDRICGYRRDRKLRRKSVNVYCS